jgi:hypothetical protein
MRTIVYLVIAFIVITLAGVLAFGQEAAGASTLTSRIEKRQMQMLKRHMSMPVGSISADNVNSYFVGYDFEAAAQLISAGKTREALAQLAFLWDELSGQAEAQQIESVMRMVIRAQGTREQTVQKLTTAQTTIEGKLRGDRRWYYEVGKTYSQMYISVSDTLETPDLRTFKLKLVELGKLARTAPVGTPVEFVGALAKLGEYGGKQSMTEQDVNEITQLWETIDKTIYA